jgi:diaminopimelate decarboxylase
MEPLVAPPSGELVRAVAERETPALTYDLDGLARSLSVLLDDVAQIPGAKLNFALKACHTPTVLRNIALCGLGADVASIGELELAREAGFKHITATGPSFLDEDFHLLADAGVTLDASSWYQLDQLCRSRPGSEVGVRLRVPLPPGIDDGVTTFGANSRFGLLATDPRIARTVADNGCTLVRLHTHTGQMSPEHLVYKAKYLLAVAEAYPTIRTVDMGGGFLGLYVSRSKAMAAMSHVGGLVRDWQKRTGRPIALEFEPGGGVLAAHGFLTVTVISAESNHEALRAAQVLTVDSSAWNLAPWHRPQVLALGRSDGESVVRTLIAGNTLYENDFFGTDVLGNRRYFELEECVPGDTLLLTASGAYTVTNARIFNRLPLPAQYVFAGGQIEGPV